MHGNGLGDDAEDDLSQVGIGDGIGVEVVVEGDARDVACAYIVAFVVRDGGDVFSNKDKLAVDAVGEVAGFVEGADKGLGVMCVDSRCAYVEDDLVFLLGVVVAVGDFEDLSDHGLGFAAEKVDAVEVQVKVLIGRLGDDLDGDDCQDSLWWFFMGKMTAQAQIY